MKKLYCVTYQTPRYNPGNWNQIGGMLENNTHVVEFDEEEKAKEYAAKMARSGNLCVKVWSYLFAPTIAVTFE